MSTRNATIGSSVGLHARPASLFVQAARATGLAITITTDGGRSADAHSILAVMGLGAKSGDTVTLSAEGDATAVDAALESLVELLGRDLDAD